VPQKAREKILTGPVVTFMEPEDHVPVIGVTLCAESYIICARAKADTERRKARDLRSMGEDVTKGV